MSSFISNPVVTDQSVPALPQEFEAELQPFFKVIEDVMQITLQSCQNAGARQFSASLEELTNLVSLPLKLLEESSIKILVSLNRDKKDLNERLTAAHRRVMQSMHDHHIQMEQLKLANCRQLHQFQIQTSSQVGHLFSVLMKDRQQAASQLSQQNASLERELKRINHHYEETKQHVEALERSLEIAQMSLQNKKVQLQQLESQSHQQADLKAIVLQAIQEQNESIRKACEKLEVTIQELKLQLVTQREALVKSRKSFLKSQSCEPEKALLLAQKLQEWLRQREIATCINVIQSLSYDQLYAALSHFENESLDLLPRIFWFHSPYLDPQTEELSHTLSISRENLPSLTTLLHLTCCYTLGPRAFELVKIEDLLPPAEVGNSQIEDLLILCEAHQTEVKKITDVQRVKKGLEKIIHFGRRQAGWHGIAVPEGEMLPELFCQQVANYVCLIKQWPPQDIAATLIQLSAIQVDCGTGVTTLIIQKLNESWRAQIGLPTDRGSWVEVGQLVLEPLRYQLFQELIVHLANSRGEVNTHSAKRFYSMAEKLSLGIRGADIANFEDEYDKKPNKFTPTRLAQFKRSFLLKYMTALVFLKLEYFLDHQVFAVDEKKQSNPDYQAYQDEIQGIWEKIYGKAPQWGQKAYQWDDDFFEVLGIRPEAKIALMEYCGFFTRRPFQSKETFDPTHQLSIGLNVFNIRMIRDALSALPSLNWRNPDSGDTLLHWIAKQHPDVMDQLLPLLDHPAARRRCNNRRGHNPMHIAARYGSYEGLKRFLDYYENELKQQNNLDLNPIIEREDPERLACFRLMVDKIHTLDPQRINRGVNGEGPPLVVLARDNRLDCLDYLITKFGTSLDLNVTRERQETALYVASIKGHTQFARKLIELGCEVDKSTHQNNAPLATAAYHGHRDLALLLIELGKADLHKKGYQGKTAIFYAAQEGHVGVLEVLYAKGGSLEDKNQSGQSLLGIASENGKKEMVKKLLDLDVTIDSFNHSQETPLFLAASKGHHEVVHLLLKKGADPLQPDQYGLIPLAIAAKKGHLKCVQELIFYTPIKEDKELGQGGSTALDMAAKEGNEECYRALERSGFRHSQHYIYLLDRDGLM